MTINSRAKGAKGEREVVQLLRDHGLTAKRGLIQNRDGSEAPDVICLEHPEWWIEVKRGPHATKWRKAITQAEAACGVATPILFSRVDNDRWFVHMDAHEFLELLTKTTATNEKT